MITPEQKEQAIHLINMGETLEAVRYIKETLKITTEEALRLTEKLKEEVDGELPHDEFKFMMEERQRKPSVDVGRVVGTIFMSIGGVMLAVVVYLSISNYQFSQRAVSVKGKVIDYETHLTRGDDGGTTTMYTPTFQYRFGGKTYTYKSNTSSSNQEYEMDESIDVLVDPEEPEEILIDTFWGMWFLPMLLAFMGLMFSGLGYMAYRFLRNRKSSITAPH